MLLNEKERNEKTTGQWCYDLADELWDIPRSLTGPGVRQTLERLQVELKNLKIHSVPSGSTAFDWTVPDEWVIRDGYIQNENGERLVSFRDNNLHIVGYSEPVDQWLNLEELNSHLYSLPEQPSAVPYVTSYYKRRWGFCMSQNQRDLLSPGKYRAVIDAELKPGVLNYGELLLPGDSNAEIFLSTYICHPAMANNELSGPVVTTALVKWLMKQKRRKYSYRIVFMPETIGSIIYLSKNLKEMKDKIFAGFNISCVGDERAYSFLPSRNGETTSDHVGKHVLKHIDPNYKTYTWLDRGSDERQYCSPGVDLPIASIMRSKYGEYPEYHTSLDTLGGVVTASGLQGGFLALKRAITILEENFVPSVTTLCEPHLGSRGLYPDISSKGSADSARIMMNMISYCDGTRSLLDISNLIEQPFWVLSKTIKPLIEAGLVKSSEI